MITVTLALLVYFIINNRSVVFLILITPLCLRYFKYLVQSNKIIMVEKNCYMASGYLYF